VTSIGMFIVFKSFQDRRQDRCIERKRHGHGSKRLARERFSRTPHVSRSFVCSVAVT
jgi:hypothetical protein